MNENSKSQAPSLQMVKLDHNQFAIELQQENVSVNLTQLAKPYGKRVSDWLKTDDSKTYLKTLSKVKKIVLADLVEVRNGGTPGTNGTWAKNRHVALRFAQWLDPLFAVAVDDLLVKLLMNKAVLGEVIKGINPVMYNGKAWYNYREAMVSIGKSKISSAAWRKAKFPQHFNKVYGRNFITAEYFHYLLKQQSFKQLQFDFEQQHALY